MAKRGVEGSPLEERTESRKEARAEMKTPTKTTMKNKTISSGTKKFLPPSKGGNHMVGKQVSKPSKKL